MSFCLDVPRDTCASSVSVVDVVEEGFSGDLAPAYKFDVFSLDF